LKRRQTLLDVVVEKKNDDDSYISEDVERDHSSAIANQMLQMEYFEISKKANFKFYSILNSKHRLYINSRQALWQKANFLYQENQRIAFLRYQ